VTGTMTWAAIDVHARGSAGLARRAAGPLVVLPLLIRRRRPVLALALVLSAGVLVPGQGSFLLAALICLYTIAATCSARVTLIASVAAVAAVILHRLVWEQLGSAGDFPAPVIACATAVALGPYSAARRASIAALRERAERLERERELLAQQTVAEERVRLANELHDVVAHNVSLIVVQAQALGATARDPAVTAATDGIAALGRQAMADMHRTLKLLRTGDDDAAIRAPQPSLAHLDGLLEQSRAAGLDVELTIEGHPRALTEGLDLSAFRIVQEALTNVIKHARRAHTRRAGQLPPRLPAAGYHQRPACDQRRYPADQRRRSRPDRHTRARRAVRRFARRPAHRRARLSSQRHAALRKREQRMNRLRVVIADDQPMMRAGFKAVLEATGNIEVVAEAGTGQEAVQAANEQMPDVVLMDIRMPGMDGIEATRRLPRQRILILTTFGLDEYILDVLRAGASGFLLKDTPTQEVIAAVRAVAAGDAVLSGSVTRQLLDQVARRLPAPITREPDAAETLTGREQEVLRMLATGLTNAEIAEALTVSEPTVKTHVSHILSKLGLRDRVQAVIYAYETGLISRSGDPHNP